MGLIFLFIPYSTEEYIIKRENGIMRDGPDYVYHYNYPDRSYDQRININLLSNESLNIYIMNSSAFSNWINNKSFNTYYEAINVINISKIVRIQPKYIGELTILMNTSQELISVSVIISTMYFFYYTWIGLIFLLIGIIFISLIARKSYYKKKIDKYQLIE